MSSLRGGTLLSALSIVAVLSNSVVSVHCCSVAQSCLTLATPWIAARQASLSFTVSRSLLKLMSIESAMPSSHLILCRHLLFLPSIFPSIRVFSNELAIHISIHPLSTKYLLSASLIPQSPGFFCFVYCITFCSSHTLSLTCNVRLLHA